VIRYFVLHPSELLSISDVSYDCLKHQCVKEYDLTTTTTILLHYLYYLRDCFFLSLINAQESLEVKQMFVRYVSHEIRTPLNTVTMGIDLAKEEVKLGKMSVESIIGLLHDIRSSSDTAVSILNGLLDYDKIERGAFYVEFESVLVLKVLHYAMRTASVQVGELRYPPPHNRTAIIKFN